MQTKTLRLDSKGRITLGSLIPKGTSSVRAFRDEKGRIILELYTEIPARERWLYENKVALKMVQEGLKEAAQGKLRSRGSFAKHLKEKDK